MEKHRVLLTLDSVSISLLSSPSAFFHYRRKSSLVPHQITQPLQKLYTTKNSRFCQKENIVAE